MSEKKSLHPDIEMLQIVANRISLTLPNQTTVSILSIPYYFATKMEAVKDRGGSDLRFSHDLEDIILIMSGNSGMEEEIKNSPKSVQA